MPKTCWVIQLDIIIFRLYFGRSNPSQPHIYNACAQCLCIVLAQCHSAAKRRGLLPFGGRFVAEICVQNFKWRVSQRGADVSYILIQLLLLYPKNLLSYTAWHNYFQAFFAVQIRPIRVCTQSLCIGLAQYHSAAKRRGLYFPSAAVL